MFLSGQYSSKQYTQKNKTKLFTKQEIIKVHVNQSSPSNTPIIRPPVKKV